ncbi:2-phospho-L-lactate guanylyltransferase [Microbacterium indicum]|uniref:2-phospho-L-lactate guanylyltransferase n=1 Tax=Microbacterium indicum TaxID=358100 RepID=UPI000412D289|nr:2-phospho-L-lactate guanylyltransferase [Microbacterium indicum]
MRWSIVVPVKATATGKSRLDGAPVDHSSLALAIALDTVQAAAAAKRVDEVVVVSSDAQVQAGVEGIDGARCIPDPGMGLNGAVRVGLERAANDARAALLGDVPALDPSDLDAALDLAERSERSVVVDAEGSGSTLVAWRAPGTFEPHFGPDSAALHRGSGFAPLEVPQGSTVRRDVDTLEQLQAAAALGLGPRTTSLLAAARAA